MREFIFCGILAASIFLLGSCAPQTQALTPEREAGIIDSLYKAKSEAMRDSMTTACGKRIVEAYE